METIKNLVESTLTETLARPTKAEPASTTCKRSKSAGLFERRSKFKWLHPEQRRMFQAAKEFAGDLNYSKPRWLTLLGPSGIGKTHLAREIYRHFRDYSCFEIGFDSRRQRVIGNTGQFCDWRKFCGDLRGGSFGRIDDLEEDWFVVLDDIGSEHDPNGFIASALDRICNTRSREGAVKWTVITCNLLLSQIVDRLDTRIADRMMRNGSVVIESNLPSYSLQ